MHAWSFFRYLYWIDLFCCRSSSHSCGGCGGPERSNQLCHILYQWSCTKPNCKSSYIGETSRSLCEWVKEHSKVGSNSAIYQHCSTKGHLPPNVDQFKVIDQEKSQIAHEAKEAIHIQKLDPELNRNVGKMIIPHVFDSLLGIKPKNPPVASLLSQEIGSQDIGINLTQFHSCVDKRVNHCSNRAQRARNFISN